MREERIAEKREEREKSFKLYFCLFLACDSAKFDRWERVDRRDWRREKMRSTAINAQD